MRLRVLPGPCRQPGCPAVVRTAYCERHQKEFYRRQDRDRPSSTGRGYGHAWRKIRAAFLAAHPICGTCQQAPATEVHHIRPRRHGGTDDWTNLRAQCRRCHSTRTVEQAFRAGEG